MHIDLSLYDIHFLLSHINNFKSSLCCIKKDIFNLLIAISSLPGTQVVGPGWATLLGSPLGDDRCISDLFSIRIDTLERMND